MPSIKEVKENIQENLKICESCEFFKPKFRRCGKCGCFVDAKVRLPYFNCPLKKWNKIF